MELRHLRYFVAAAEELHFSRAADRLCVTRPAVSRMISDLEQELGAQLFERSNQGIKLTAAGAIMLARVQSNLADLNTTFDVTKKVALGKSGILNVGYGASSLYHPVFRAAIKQVHDEFPEIVLSFVEGRRIEQLSALRDGTIDVGFMQNPTPSGAARGRGRKGANPTNELPEFARLPIQSSTLAVALPRTHPLAGRGSLKLFDLTGEEFITVSLSSISPSYGRLVTLCMDAGFEPKGMLEVKNAAAQLGLVSIGLGIGILVTLPSSRYPDDIAVVPLEGVDFSTRFELLCLKSRKADPVIRHFTDIARNCMGQTQLPLA